MEKYDVVILGGGPAGYTAAIYSARAGYKTAVIEKAVPGGQMVLTADIENYPGTGPVVSGLELGLKMQSEAENFGVVTHSDEAIRAEINGNEKHIICEGGEYEARALIIATGASPRRIGAAGEEEFIGRGVSFCAACDGMLYRGRTVAVIGGGDSAAAEALYLARICKKVYIIHRRDTLRAGKIYRDRIAAAENIEVLINRTVDAFEGDDLLNALLLKDTVSGNKEKLDVDGAFVCIGRVPETGIFRGMLELDASGFIVADETTRTSVEGVFAAGDVRTKSVRQIVTATGDGAVAAHAADEYLENLGN